MRTHRDEPTGNQEGESQGHQAQESAEAGSTHPQQFQRAVVRQENLHRFRPDSDEADAASSGARSHINGSIRRTRGVNAHTPGSRVANAPARALSLHDAAQVFEELWTRVWSRQEFRQYRDKQGQDGFTSKNEEKWPLQMEREFFEALSRWPPMKRKKLKDPCFPTKQVWKESEKGRKDWAWIETGKLERGRNELIACQMSVKLNKRYPHEFLERKFISSHIQVLKAKFRAKEDRPGDAYVLAWLGEDDDDGDAPTRTRRSRKKASSKLQRDDLLYLPHSRRRQCRVIRPSHFSLCSYPLLDPQASPKPLHVFLRTAPESRIDDLYLSKLPNWERMFPHLKYLMEHGRLYGVQDVLFVDSPLHLLDVAGLDRIKRESLAMGTKEVILTSENSFSVVCNTDLYDESEVWDCRTSWYERGDLVQEYSNSGDGNTKVFIGQSDWSSQRKEKTLRIGLGSTYLLGKITKYAEMLNDRTRHELVRNEIRNMVAIQEIRRKSDTTRDGKWTTVAVILWHFRLDRASFNSSAAPEGTTWRNICISFAEPTTHFETQSIARAADRRAGAYLEHLDGRSTGNPYFAVPAHALANTGNHPCNATFENLGGFLNTTTPWSRASNVDFSDLNLTFDFSAPDFILDTEMTDEAVRRQDVDSVLDTNGNAFNFAGFIPQVEHSTGIEDSAPKPAYIYDGATLNEADTFQTNVAQTTSGARLNPLHIDVSRAQAFSACYAQTESTGSNPTSATSSMTYSAGAISPAHEYSAWQKRQQENTLHGLNAQYSISHKTAAAQPTFANIGIDLEFLNESIYPADSIQADERSQALLAAQPRYAQFTGQVLDPGQTIPATPLQTLKSQPRALFPAQIATPVASPPSQQEDMVHTLDVEGHVTPAPTSPQTAASDKNVPVHRTAHLVFDEADGNDPAAHGQDRSSQRPKGLLASQDGSLEGQAEVFYDHNSHSYTTPISPGPPVLMYKQPYSSQAATTFSNPFSQSITQPGEQVVTTQANEEYNAHLANSTCQLQYPVDWLPDEDPEMQSYITVSGAPQIRRHSSYTKPGEGEHERLARLFHPEYFATAGAGQFEQSKFNG